MIVKKACFIVAISIMMVVIAACSQATATPLAVVETVIVKEVVEVERPVEVIVTKEIEKEVEKVVTVEVEKEVIVIETIEVEKEVTVVETVEVVVIETVEIEVTPTPEPPTATPTVDFTHPRVYEVLNEITYVQHHHDPITKADWFTCASGKGLRTAQNAPETKSAEGPRYVGPNCGDFPLWGVNGLFEVYPDGITFFVPQTTGGRFLSPEGIEYDNFSLDEALRFFETGDVFWTGEHGEPGRIAACDPRCEGN